MNLGVIRKFQISRNFQKLGWRIRKIKILHKSPFNHSNNKNTVQPIFNVTKFFSSNLISNRTRNLRVDKKLSFSKAWKNPHRYFKLHLKSRKNFQVRWKYLIYSYLLYFSPGERAKKRKRTSKSEHVVVLN